MGECPGVGGDGRWGVEADAAGWPVDMDEPERRYLAELEDREPGAAARILTGREWQDPDGDVGAAGAHVGEVAELGARYLGAPDLLPERCLPDQDCQAGAVLVQSGLLAGELGGCLCGFGVLGHVGVCGDDGACVVRSLQ